MRQVVSKLELVPCVTERSFILSFFSPLQPLSVSIPRRFFPLDENGSREERPLLHFWFDQIFRPELRFVPWDEWLDIKKLEDCEITRCHEHSLRGLDSGNGILPLPYPSLSFPLRCCQLHRGSMLSEYLRSFDK